MTTPTEFEHIDVWADLGYDGRIPERPETPKQPGKAKPSKVKTNQPASIPTRRRIPAVEIPKSEVTLTDEERAAGLVSIRGPKAVLAAIRSTSSTESPNQPIDQAAPISADHGTINVNSSPIPTKPS